MCSKNMPAMGLKLVPVAVCESPIISFQFTPNISLQVTSSSTTRTTSRTTRTTSRTTTTTNRITRTTLRVVLVVLGVVVVVLEVVLVVLEVVLVVLEVTRPQVPWGVYEIRLSLRPGLYSPAPTIL